MKNPWFKRFGWLYAPITWQGAAILILPIIFCVQVFMAIDRHSHSVSDTFYKVFPYFSCCFLLLNWAAGNASRSGPASDAKTKPSAVPEEVP